MITLQHSEISAREKVVSKYFKLVIKLWKLVVTRLNEVSKSANKRKTARQHPSSASPSFNFTGPRKE